VTPKRTYCIVVRGEFGELLKTAFEHLPLQVGNGTTTLLASVADQAELHGVMERLRDFAIELVSVQEAPGDEDAPGIEGPR
jgi:hypothetical protein